MTSLSDVAAAAGVSVSVVSRVLNDAPDLRVRPETRQRVLAEARRLEYVPNLSARGLRLGVTGTLGLVLPGVTHTFDELLRGVEDTADLHGQTILLARAERVDERGEFLRRLVREGRVDGLMVQLTDEEATEDVVREPIANLPVVLINAHSRQAGSVVLDNARGMEVAAEHLIGLGHVDLGYVGGVPTSFTATTRERGFISALKAAGLQPRAAWSTSLGYTTPAGRAAVDEIWSRPGPWPTALVVANPNAAYGVLAELRARGIGVPEDVSVVTLHDTWVAQLLNPTLTTVELPLYGLGVAATELLIKRLNGGPIEHRLVSSPAPVLHQRESTSRVA